jgi:hypothetical protein
VEEMHEDEENDDIVSPHWLAQGCDPKYSKMLWMSSKTQVTSVEKYSGKK